MIVRLILKRLRYRLALKLVSTIVFGVGLLLIIEVLFSSHPIIHHKANALFVARLSNAAPLAIGLAFVYLGLLLRRRKHAAWLIATALFVIYLFGSILVRSYSDIILALISLFGLIKYRREFIVKSGLNSSWVVLRNIIFAIVLMLTYGIIGFLLLDRTAFGREISFSQSIYYTIDTFRLFSEDLKPLTVDGRILLDSLYIINFMTIAYVIASIFGPLRERFVDQTIRREKFAKLIEDYSSDSEDFFKVWPKDKHYLIYKNAGLAYKTVSGVALVVGNPVGLQKDIKTLVAIFIDQCHINDWTVAFINIDDQYKELFETCDLDVQKLGEEAVINLKQFTETTIHNKHFRNICNRFEKLGYSTELLQPPHSQALLDALKRISDSWLSLPDKTERTFMLGYFDKDYLNDCPILMIRDDAKQIIGFLNQVPTKTSEANIDLMRHLKDAIPNVSDYMFVNFMKEMQQKGYQTVNIGLCPLAGISNIEEKSALTNVLKFVYQNGNRLFGFSGLERFKKKFEPRWKNRYVAYQDGAVGFTRSMMAVNKAMQVKKSKSNHDK
ncbi:MAG TPA: phosphatidylglycerol lysyltransferase domain-containing protein [Patescibacteria group bacterium]|nr:phosphatidylglycerol lysyltransferase domain-containing protein [Patescibacteria group bacterium]